MKKVLLAVLAVVLLVTVVSPTVSSAESSLKGFKYSSKVPMPKKQQEYLYKLSKARGLNYYDMLAVIKIESSFNPKTYSGDCYGYFQIWKGNRKTFAKKLKTADKPYNPYINMNWGTHELSDLTKKFKKQGKKGKALKDAVLSAYNKGYYGYLKHGKAKTYIKNHEKALKTVKSWF